MYYGSNPKVQKLLDEVENEMNEAEKRAKTLARNERIKSFLSSRWFIFLIVVFIMIILAIITFSWIYSGFHSADKLLFVGFPEIVIFAFLLFRTASWAMNDKRK